MKPARYITWTIALSLTTLVGCGVPGIPKPPSLDLPRPVTDLRAVRKGDRVYLAWTIPTENTDGLQVRAGMGPVVCRGPGAMRPGCAGGVLPAMPSSQFVPKNGRATFADTLPPSVLGNDPNAEIFYSVTIFNHNNRSAGISNIVSVPAVVAAPPPSNFRADLTAEGVILTWAGAEAIADTGQLRRLYRVYRRDEKTNQDAVAAEAPIASTSVVDHSFEWEKTYFYRATAVNIVQKSGQPETQFEGDDTPAVKLFVHDIFPPAVPNGLQAAFSGVGQQPFIDLTWGPDTEADLAGYNVYRHEQGGQPSKINSAPINPPSFRDSNVASGRTYIYSVTAIDVRGNESARSAETSESVP